MMKSEKRKEESYRPSMADKIKSPLKNPTNWKFDLPEGAKEAAVVLAKTKQIPLLQ